MRFTHIVPGTDKVLPLLVSVIFAPHKPATFFVALDVYIANDGNDNTGHIKSTLSNGNGFVYLLYIFERTLEINNRKVFMGCDKRC
jgi:hypothetical protein